MYILPTSNAVDGDADNGDLPPEMEEKVNELVAQLPDFLKPGFVPPIRRVQPEPQLQLAF